MAVIAPTLEEIQSIQSKSDYEAEYEMNQAMKRLEEHPHLFGKYTLPTAFKHPTPPFHRNIYASLKDRSKDRVLIAAPRGSAKSTVASLVYPSYRIAFGEEEDLFIAIISESGKQARNFLGRLKHHLTFSDEFRLLFGDYSDNTSRRWREDDIILKDGTRIVALGTGQSIRGYIEGDTRPNIIIVDDFESEKNATTPEARIKNRKWLTEAVIPSCADEAKVIVIGTVISEDCFLFYAKDSEVWDVQWYTILDEEGNSLWKEKFPKSRIQKIRREYESVDNLRGFYQEYMNRPQPPEEAPFKPQYFKGRHEFDYERRDGWNVLVKTEYIDGEKEETVKPVNVYMGIDTASSLSVRADYFVIAVVAVDSENTKYIVDIFRKRLDPAKQPDKIISMWKKYHPDKTNIETVAYQEALRANVRAKMKKEGIYIAGIESGAKPRNKKSERLISMVPMLARGRLKFRQQDDIAVDEFLSYPTGKHDDIMDAIWMALDKAKPCRLEETQTKKDDDSLYSGDKIDWRLL